MMPYTEYREQFVPIIEVLSVDYLEAVTAQAVEVYHECLRRKK